jgi:hypothetical protein
MLRPGFTRVHHSSIRLPSSSTVTMAISMMRSRAGRRPLVSTSRTANIERTGYVRAGVEYAIGVDGRRSRRRRLRKTPAGCHGAARSP